MSSVVFSDAKNNLTAEKLTSILSTFKEALIGRVKEAYIFGSASAGTHNEDSDIDIILVKDVVGEPFMLRPMEFQDLYRIWPRLDILVYSPAELYNQLADSEVGFWESVRTTMKRFV